MSLHIGARITFGTERTKSLVSIHDVMPHNLSKIDYCLAQLKSNQIGHCYLLVVPGLEWDECSLARLRQYVAEGHTLVAHGWVHKAANISTTYHRLHSLLISKDVAEHLCWSKLETISNMQRSRSWFSDNQLPVPDFYVPPAWALGKLSMEDLMNTGFRYVETTTGVFDLTAQKKYLLPLVGYEARSLFNSMALRASNACNWGLSKFFRSRVLRVAIHPDDFELDLSKSLQNMLTQVRPSYIEQTIPSLGKAPSNATCLK